MLLGQASSDPAAAERLFQEVYTDLQAIARARMKSERENHTLQATALVSEAYLRVIGAGSIQYQDRRHFFCVASEAMRRILIDHARARLAQKRDGGRMRFELSEGDGIINADPARLLELDEALSKLREEDERSAQLAEMRFFGGLTLEAIAELLDVSLRTANRDWKFAKARLAELLSDD
jgi:RNA polymerase sigma factor (TIGR02999 family)